MTLPDGVRVDDEGNVTFEGHSGQTLLLHILMRAKFARPFEPVSFLNEWMAELILGLHTRFRAGLPTQSPQSDGMPLFGDDPQTRLELAEVILMDADRTGWWTWSRERQIDFIRSVACVPHLVSNFTVEEVLLLIEDELDRARRLLAAADYRAGKAGG